jgi:hypothetical protein
MALSEREVEHGLPQLDLEQAAEDDGRAAVGEAFENGEAWGILRLVGEQRLSNHVGVEHHGLGRLPAGRVEGEHATPQRWTTAHGHRSAANPGRG